MRIDRVHFYVEDARASRNWFVEKLGFQSVANDVSNFHTQTEVVKNGSVCFVLSSPLTPLSPVAEFLRQHSPGVADITFCVEDVALLIQKAIAYGAKVLQPLQQQEGCKWGKIAAWGSLSHTLIERQKAEENFKARTPYLYRRNTTSNSTSPIFSGIDHIVLNVASGDLESAVAWYRHILDFHSQQAFTIQTERSSLHSQVMVSCNRCVQLPINQPASPNSQIQEFLNVNQGAGIQHIALHTPNLVSAIAQFRNQGVSFLPVPSSYYKTLQHRQEMPLSANELQAIAQQQILVDWQVNAPHALLLQTFTQPIFNQPTFFFELIERRSHAVGFGEGNFRALFEAIEREQIKRGSLQDF